MDSAASVSKMPAPRAAERLRKNAGPINAAANGSYVAEIAARDAPARSRPETRCDAGRAPFLKTRLKRTRSPAAPKSCARQFLPEQENGGGVTKSGDV